MRIIIFDILPKAEIANLEKVPTDVFLGLARLEKSNTLIMVDVFDYVEYSPLIWELECQKS